MIVEMSGVAGEMSAERQDSRADWRMGIYSSKPWPVSKRVNGGRFPIKYVFVPAKLLVQA
jgi:hypothetical protein